MQVRKENGEIKATGFKGNQRKAEKAIADFLLKIDSDIWYIRSYVYFRKDDTFVHYIQSGNLARWEKNKYKEDVSKGLSGF